MTNDKNCMKWGKKRETLMLRLVRMMMTMLRVLFHFIRNSRVMMWSDGGKICDADLMMMKG